MASTLSQTEYTTLGDSALRPNATAYSVVLRHLQRIYPTRVFNADASEAQLREYFGQQQVINTLAKALADLEAEQASASVRRNYVQNT